MAFDGFSKVALRFLTALGSEDKAWFDANRATYQREVVVPSKAFVTDLGQALVDQISPRIVAQPKANGSISPINNDVRFARDKPPYKNHLLFRFWEGPDKKTAPTLFVRISEADVWFASGTNFVSVGRWRDLIDDERAGSALSGAVDTLGQGRRLDVAGQGVKKVPKPYPADHARAELLKHKGFQARWLEPTPTVIHSGDFVAWCAVRLVECAPIHRWLVTRRP
jgi:uncharacterized protein (TIGR02453 family)